MPPSPADLVRIQLSGQWLPGQVLARFTSSTQVMFPKIHNRISAAWDDASTNLGSSLFDGPMCRMESFDVVDGQLVLNLSRTSYRIFLGTNMRNPDLADRYGPQALANPVGLSCALETSDACLVMGRRNDRVAYYPNRVHPFAGALEPADPLEVFVEMARELEEEIALTRGELQEFRCLGIAEDRSLRQPELIFHARTRRSRSQIQSRLRPDEHDALWHVPADSMAVSQAMRDSALTPIAIATLLFWNQSLAGPRPSP